MSEHKPVLVDPEAWAKSQVEAAARGLLLPAKRGRRRKDEPPVKVRGVCFRPRMNGEAIGPKGEPGEWFACYFDATGQKHREKAGTKSTALALYQRRKSEVRQGRQFPESLRRVQAVTLADVCAAYVAYLKVNGRDTRNQVEARLREVQAILGGVVASSVQPADVEKLKGVLAEVPGWGGLRKPATVNKAVQFLRAAYGLARRNGLVTANPVQDVRRLRENNARTRELTPEEETKLLEALEPAKIRSRSDYRPLVRLLIASGLRVGEAVNLRWSDVDWKAELLTLRQTKAGKVQHAHLNGAALGILRGLQAIGSDDGEAYIFSRRGGKPWRPSVVTHAFQRAAVAAGVKDCRLHDCRHTFASRLVRRGVGIFQVSRLLRHASVAMSERYSHLTQADLKAAINFASDTLSDTGKKATW